VPSKNWKKVELDVARFFGSERNPLSGINAKHTGSDSLHPVLYIECKSGKSLPKFFTKIWDKAVTNARKEGKIPLVVLKPKNYHGFMVICDSNTITDIIDQRGLVK